MKSTTTTLKEISFYKIVSCPIAPITLYDQTIPAGFPSPAADYFEDEIDFNAYLKPKPLSTFAVKVQGESMTGAFIPDGALLVVDKSLKPGNNMIVVAVIDGEFTVKRYIKNSSGIRLMPANPKYQPIPITEEMDFRVWGVVTKIIIDPISLGL